MFLFLVGCVICIEIVLGEADRAVEMRSVGNLSNFIHGKLFFNEGNREYFPFVY